MDLNKKRILITGGGSGIGLAMARSLAFEGAHVVITGRDHNKLVAAAANHPNISSYVCDVADEAAIISLRDSMDADGGTDVLVNNAGIMHSFDVTQGFPLEKQLQEIDIDVSGPVRLVHYFLPGMLRRESVIINVSSGLAYTPYASAPVYSASKAFLHSYTQSLRAQLADTSVRVVELLPPVVDTELATDLDPSFPRISPEKLVAALIKGLKNNTDEITPGQSAQLKLMSRVAPGLLFQQMNKNI
ncbi:SDR family NAD(P)-dependent oxidoreductase [Nodularia harveyana UHCC-0300]|uniref:SDR family NAD(P)-dependent oxidoreductase n=1 Tax=Nodularia harveyana UHCC-0300 TaxID=2974287 RepID=A0ABU5UGL7_9CYAN|nr:SDR family NAD(P)-dependent oxidoreductase [Nodularia harveyana]MEA5582702.1 SDR family NAD(P)-dependent oxidoreductase [Nodularia harveyana UHCC-0300]